MQSVLGAIIFISGVNLIEATEQKEKEFEKNVYLRINKF